MSQSTKILNHLVANAGEWVPMPKLVKVSRSYVIHSRVAGLRAKGHKIANRLEIGDGITRSFYKLEL